MNVNGKTVFNRSESLIENACFCDMNLYPDGPKTVEEARKIGPQLCPHAQKCNSGFLHPESGHQCVMEMGREVAKYAIKERHSIEEEMKDFIKMGPRPKKGWVYSLDRENFHVITDRKEVIRLVHRFAHLVLVEEVPKEEGKTGGDKKESVVGDTFDDVLKYATDPKTGKIDLRKMEKLEGRFGKNGGRGCDVRKGPCSCGAWH